MRTSKILISNLLIVLYIFSYAQNSDKTIEDEHKLLVKYSPFSLMGDWVTNSSGIQIGVEYKLRYNISIQQDVRYIFRIPHQPVNIFAVSVKNLQGIRSDTELKFYLKKFKNLTGTYLAPHLLYQYTHATREETVVDYFPEVPGFPEPSYINEYTVNKNSIALHLKIGKQHIYKRGLVIDFAIGIGLRYISNTSINKQVYNFSDSQFAYNMPYDEERKLFPSVSGSLKIGWTLK